MPDGGEPSSGPGAGGIFDDARLAEVTATLSGHYLRLFAAEPCEARTGFADDVLEFSFREGLTAPELALRERRELDGLRRARERGLVATGAQLAVPVERLTRSQVGFHLGLFDSETAETSLLFGFEGASTYDPDRPTTLLTWTVEMRRKALELSREGASLRESSAEIVAHFRDQRRARLEDFVARREARRRRSGAGD